MPVAPTINTQPTSQAVSAGAPVTFYVTASGTAPLSYQWRRDGADIVGATASSYVIPTARLNDVDHKWSVVVRNAAGSAGSTEASLNVTGIEVLAGIPEYSVNSEGSSEVVDGIGSLARFVSPIGLTINSMGDLYIGDRFGRTVRKITPAGIVTTFAGLANQGGGVDGVGANARFGGPGGLAFDAAGNLYVADCYTMSIRKITPAAEVTTVATIPFGNNDGRSAGRFMPGAIAIDADGNMYITNGVGTRKITPSGVVTILEGVDHVDGSFGTAFLRPRAVLADDVGNLVVADLRGGISTISTTGSVMQLAGTADINWPGAMARDRAGNIFIADIGNGTIRKLTPSGVVTTVVGVAGTNATVLGALPGGLNHPSGIAVAADGTIYVTSGYAVLQIRLP